MPKGNPNPSPSTRFGAKNGNPIAGGKSKKQRELEYRAAEDAAELRARMLSIIKEKTSGDDDALLAMLKADTLKLFKDSEDRAHGTPKSTSELSGPEGGAIPVTTVEFLITDPNGDEDTSEGR